MDNDRDNDGAKGVNSNAAKRKPGRPRVDSDSVTFRVPVGSKELIKQEVRRVLADIKSGKISVRGQANKQYKFWFEGYDDEYLIIYAENAEEAYSRGLELHGRQIDYMMYREI
jgi:hypothetical protein